MVDCYVGIGGNQAGTLQVMRQIITQLKNDNRVANIKVSKLYQTSPVSNFPQPDFLNAVARFQTQLSVNEVWQMLCKLEKNMGKIPKAKDQPRLIDLDLLFYGAMVQQTEACTLPHPRWHERLFVLVPLSDVTETLPVNGEVKMTELLKNFSNPHQEQVILLQERLEDA
jgi:2-amino-4-hydroxy-6-hydroxymethyldihydropteridine diphosphokinase